MACERRPGSRTKLASIESNATPASSTPARRSTCQSYLMLWPALGTAGSWSSATSGAIAKSVIGGRFLTGVGAASSPPRGRWPNGRYQTSVGTRGQREADQLGVVRLERVGLGVERHQRRRAEPLDAAPEWSSGSSRTTTSSAGWRVDGEPVGGGGERRDGRALGEGGDGALVRLELAFVRAEPPGTSVERSPLRSLRVDFLELGAPRRRSPFPAPPSAALPALPSSAPARRTPAR